MTETRVKRILLAALLAIGGFVAIFALPFHAYAAINPQINFQGKLTNTDGTNVTNGTYSIVFSIYSVSTGGTAVWTETQPSVAVADGIFKVALGSVTALPGSVDFNSNSLYLGVKVGADAEMLPRIQFTATPYAFNSDKLGGIASTGYVQLSPSGQQTGTINISGNVTAGGTYNGNTFSSSALAFSAASAATVQSASSQALNITGNAASMFSTSAGQLTLQSGSGTVSLGTSTTLTANAALNIVSATTNALTLDSGTTGAVNVGTGANAKAITVGNTTTGTTITQKVGAGTSAFSIQSSADTFLAIDATNDRIYIGGSTPVPAPTLFVLGLKSTTGDPTGVNGAEYYNSTNNKFRCYQNGSWSDCVDGFTSITKLTDQVANSNSTALQNDNTLYFSMAASTTYVFDAWIPVNASNATADFKWGITVPTGTTFNVSGTSNAGICGVVSSGSSCAYTTTNPVTMMVKLTGVATTGTTAGNLQFQFAQNTATTGAFPVIKKGAILSWRKTL
jgi:hypothetical protein